MPFLKQQIQVINSSLKATAFADARFSGSLIVDIAKDARRGEESGETFPVWMNESYEAQDVSVNDKYPMVIYHKVKQIGYKVDPQNGFGDGTKGMIESAIIKMMVYGKYSALKLSREELEALIITNFPDNIPNKAIADLKLNNLTAILQGSNLDSSQLWSEEYKNVEMAIAPEDIYFSIVYNLQSSFKKGCFKVCDCAANNE